MKSIINDIVAVQNRNLLNIDTDDDIPAVELNTQQLSAVNCKSRIIYVNAGPGTGKTHLLTSKIVEFILDSNTPQRIVALSYTNTAANHIGEKFKEKAEAAEITKEYTFYYGTIHSFCYSLLRTYNSSVSEGTGEIILDDEELRELADELFIQLNKAYPVMEIERCLRKGQKKDEELQSLVDKYKKNYKVLSIHDILANFIKALDEDSHFREWIKGQITAMAIDEAQDLSEENYIILEKLLDICPKLRVFLVGDPRQNIFEFNGGSYKHLEEFLKRQEKYTTKHLTLTYRCAQSIADYVNHFSFTDCENTQLKSMCKNAGDISVHNYYSDDEEAKAVVDEIASMGELNDSAILSNNLMYLTPILVRLKKSGIPYKVLGGRRLLKPHIRLLKPILRIIENDNEYSMRKVAEAGNINLRPPVGVKMTIKEMFYESSIGTKISAVKEEFNQTEQSLYALMMNVLTQIMRIPKEGSEIADDYEKILELSHGYTTISEYLLAFVTDKDSFACFYRKDYPDCEVPVENTYLTISTIHSAKGLEWKNVFIVGLSEGNFPNPYFCKDKPLQKQKEFFNNEWKKMYVAATRAKEKLHLSYPDTITRRGYTFRLSPSRFISCL